MIQEFQNEFRWLSNFSQVEIKLGGLVFPSVEHAYMSAKSDSKEWKEFCTDKNNTAGQIKRKSKSVVLVENWDKIKMGVMSECIEQKFNQEPFKALLLATKNEFIQEGNRWGDKFWGFCLKTNQGENNLGKLIMKKRESLLKNILPFQK